MFGLQLANVELHDQPYDYDKALAQVPPDHRSVAIFPTSPVFFRDRHRLADFALGRELQRFLACANGSMQVAYCPMA